MFDRLQVRVVMVDGEPWFVLTDVCAILGFRDAYNASRMLDDDEKGYSVVSTPGGLQKVMIVSESGLYALMFRSGNDEARKFRKHVTSVILPEIRKTGAFLPTQPIPASPYDVMRMAIDNIERVEVEQRRQAEQISFLDSRVTDVETVSPLVGPSDLMTLRDLAHACDTGRTRMARWLRDNGVMFTDQDGHHRLMQHPWMEQGLARESWERTENGVMFAWVPRWTPRGIARIRRMRADLL